MKVLMVTSEWPDPKNPNGVPFVVRQVEFLRRRGVEVNVFHFRGSGNPINYFKAWKKCRHILKEFRPDIIHAQWGQSVLPILPKSAPLVITYRGDDLEGVINQKGEHGLKSLVLRNVGRWVVQFADRIMIVAPHLQKKIKSDVPVYVIPSGIDFSKMPKISKNDAKATLGLPVDKKVIIFPNNPNDRRKNLALVEKTLAALKKSDKENIFFHKVFGVSHEKLMIHMKAADFMIFTSLHEGSPNVVKEALANDVAVISVPVGDTKVRLTNVPGCGVSESYDAIELANLLSQNLNFSSNKGQLREYVSHLDENIMIEKVIKIYQEAIKHYLKG